jgi:small-conductance mechanosensitive channel
MSAQSKSAKSPQESCVPEKGLDKRSMRTREKVAAISLTALLAATLLAIWRTSGPTGTITGKIASGTTSEHVDQRSLLTVTQLLRTPTTADEVPIATEALRLADQEMDLAFAAAVRNQEQHPPELTAEARAIQDRIQNAESALDADNSRIAQLTALEAKATGPRKDALDRQLQEAKAQAELDQDEVDEGKADLEQAGGDLQGRLEALTQEHDAASKASDSLKVSITASTAPLGLIHSYQQWSALHSKQLMLWSAKQDAEDAAAAFGRHYNQLKTRVVAQKQKAESLARASTLDSAAIVAATKSRASEQKTLTSLNKRIEDQRQLASVYDRWIAVVAAQQTIVINHAARGILVVLLIALVAIFFDGWIARLFGKLKLDRRQLETLRTVTRVALQVVSVLLILLVIFGPPSQLGTILGLAGAGLTVALKDFIVGFLGWLVLMGKNGIRLGDWVEINGVTGEVAELGMFHTVLLETGNWTDSGHPTGRRVTFTNSFAIEGHYFNFSTSGQWLWDEVRVVVPLGQDPHPIIDAIQKEVSRATEHTVAQAEREWQNAAKSRGLSALSAAPAINIKPVIGGIEVAVRYITRASERYQLRTKLYQTAVEFIGQKPADHKPEKLTARA